MILLYRIGILAYTLAVRIAALFNNKAKQFSTGRKGLLDSIKAAEIAAHQPIWVHCSSLGEFEQARSIIDALHAQGEKILVTFFSPSGYEIRKTYPAADWVFYLPLDTAQNAADFIKYTRPKKAIFVKYDLWYFYLDQLQKKRIPSFLISAHFRAEQIYFKPLMGKLHRKMLRMFQHIYLQDKQSMDLLAKIDITHASIAGDTRVDGVLERVQKANNLPLIETFLEGKKAIVLGSAYLQEIDILLPCLSAMKGEKIIIAPHEINRSNIANIQNKIGPKTLLYSELEEDSRSADILIIDNIGNLFDIYAYAKWAFIGGAYETGLHNTLEPAAYGLPICFGPKYSKFVESVGMVNRKCAYPVRSADELEALYLQLENDSHRSKIIRQVKEYMIESKGATDRILKELSS